MTGRDESSRVRPLSVRTRRRLLRDLLRRADAGEVAAAEALVRLSVEAEREASDGK